VADREPWKKSSPEPHGTFDADEAARRPSSLSVFARLLPSDPLLSIERMMNARPRLSIALALLLLCAGAVTAAPARAADGGEDGMTMTEVVNDAIIGHATDGNYLGFKPFGTVELPRIFLVRTAEGGLSVDAYGSTKSALKSGAYGLVPHSGDEEGESESGEGASGEAGHDELITSEAGLEEAFAAKAHLHSPVQRVEGSIVADFSITRHLIFGLLAMGIVVAAFVVLARKYRRGTGRTEAPRGIFQNMMEVMVVFIRDEVAKPNIGPKYKKFLPYLLSAFFFILVANILGLVPYAGSATSNIAVTGALALLTLVIGQLYGTKEHFKHLFTGPPDAPIFVRIILVPIEIIGLLARHLALAVRLFANMMGGALIIFSLIGIVFILNILFGEVAAWVTGLFSTGFTVFILLLKLLVAFIQAYVFTALSAVYIGMSVEEHGHDDHEDEASVAAGDRAAATDVGGNGVADERTRVSEPSGEPVAAG
jgi:F-type H+-transporting ATPase subunit a